MAKPYNGHHCWNCWNVALWIGNDEGLYRYALACKHASRLAGDAARTFIRDMPEKTPDGARWTFTAVRSAIAGLE